MNKKNQERTSVNIATVSQKLKKEKAVIIICQTSNQIATMEESYCS
jgi:hypothetical protein